MHDKHDVPSICNEYFSHKHKKMCIMSTSVFQSINNNVQLSVNRNIELN